MLRLPKTRLFLPGSLCSWTGIFGYEQAIFKHAFPAFLERGGSGGYELHSGPFIYFLDEKVEGVKIQEFSELQQRETVAYICGTDIPPKRYVWCPCIDLLDMILILHFLTDPFHYTGGIWINIRVHF